MQLSGSLTTDRRYHKSGLLPNGRVIIVGVFWGVNPSSAITSDIFDPATETVVAGPDMTRPRNCPSGASLGGKFYACGDDLDGVGGKQCEVYDPSLNSWQPIASAQFNHDVTDLGKQAVKSRISKVVGIFTHQRKVLLSPA